MGQTGSWLRGEPNLRDVMLDPIVQLLMRSDGLTPEMVWPFLRATSARLRGEPEEAAEAAKAVGALAPLLSPQSGDQRPQ